MKVFNLSRIGGETTDLTLIGGTVTDGTMKVNKTISNFKEFKIIHQSVTGLYEKQVDLLTV